MKQFRRRTARTILVPIALFIIVLGGALPASAAPLTTANSAVTSAAPSFSLVIGRYSLSW